MNLRGKENERKQISNALAVGRRHDDLLQFAVVPALDAALGPSREDLFHLAPVLAVLQDVLANLAVLLEAEVVLGDAGPQVVQVALADLLGREFSIVGKVLGILELISFHFSPRRWTSATTRSSSSCDQLRSLVHMEMRL
jgi:hypothetical protein